MDRGRFRVPAATADGAAALGVAALQLGSGLSGPHPSGWRALLGCVLLAAGGAALAARRRAPQAVLAATAACAAGWLAAGFEVLAVSYLVAVYGAVRAGHRNAAVAVSAALVAVLHLTAPAVHGGPLREVVAQARGTLELAWLIAAFAAGEAVRQAERRAEQAERTREETARRRADEERLRIARELHDSLTHQISVIKVQSEAAVHVARRRGEQVPPALLAIRDAGREAGRELRATLEALRADGTAPPPGLGDLPGLVERFRETGTGSGTGLEVTLTIEGRPCPVPAAVGRTAYRIVQEALTNVARHAAAGRAAVVVDHRPGLLAVRVDDDGKGAPHPPTGAGLGLLGMRERVTALGGRLHTGPRGTCGFSVRAELPVDGAP
ncbi:sensor histidine kinase [Streptomyces globosus]|uniref:sensor histidine kinase n=1 Tax=Streptomyces globosus TaxID=68209 RepID=UPI003630960A